METQTKFDIMFEAINVHNTDKVTDIVNTLAARTKRSKEEEQVLFVAKCVLDDRNQVNA
jgi:hypothetical protein